MANAVPKPGLLILLADIQADEDSGQNLISAFFFKIGTDIPIMGQLKGFCSG
jgi:hypothetical protein